MINRILKTVIMIKILDSYKDSVDPLKLAIENFNKLWDLIKEK